MTGYGRPEGVRAGLLGRILSHCYCPLTNKAPMTIGLPSGSQWPHACRAGRRAVIRTLPRVNFDLSLRFLSRFLPRFLPRSAVHSIAAVACGFGALLAASPAQAVYAIARYGRPKSPAGFKHFDYVNPDAPKGGTLVLANPDRLTSFDKFNPFTMRGNTAPGIGVLFESLTTGSSDEVASAYGLLADDISVAPAGLSTTFHIHPRPHFSNDDPGTADAVKF